MRIFLLQAFETLFRLSKNILPLLVVAEKIDETKKDASNMHRC